MQGIDVMTNLLTMQLVSHQHFLLTSATSPFILIRILLGLPAELDH